MAAAELIAVIADDLTGASDAGVQFARRGVRSVVVLDRADLRQFGDAQAVAVDANTRGLSAEAAYRRVRQVAGQLRQLAPGVVYKKVDSTLRGNLSAEIDGVMDAFGFGLALIAPAYPPQGRTTRGGIHYLHNVPVHQAEPGRDPKTPVRDADLVRVLRSGSRRDVRHIGLEIVRAGLDDLRADVAAHGAGLLVYDAETNSDLRAIADGFRGRDDVLWVGSAGLAEQLVESLGYHVSGVTRTWPTTDGPVLTVVGSPSEVTRGQVAALAGHACCFEIDQRDALHAALYAGRDAVLVGISDELARVAAECVRAYRIGGLILTGGETARAVCLQLGVAAIELHDEVEPGVPIGLLIGGMRDHLMVVTKAGAFGSDRTLLHAIQKLKGGNIA